MQQYKFHDELLWRSMPEGADIVRAFFSEDRERRVLIFRRKDGTFSYTQQTLTGKRWCGTESEQTFRTEEDLLAHIGGQTQGMFGFVPVMRTRAPRELCEKKRRPFLLFAVPSAAIFVCGVVLFVLCLTNVFPEKYFIYGFLIGLFGVIFLSFFLTAAILSAPVPTSSLLPLLPREAIVFLYRKVDLPEGGRVFFDEEGTRRVAVYRREDGCYTYTEETLYIETDTEELDFSSAYACWGSEKDSVSFYDSEESVLRDISYLLEGMTEYCKREV